MMRALISIASDAAELLALGRIILAIACLYVASAPDRTSGAHHEAQPGLVAYAEAGQ